MLIIDMVFIFLFSFFLNGLLKKVAPFIGAVDQPNERRMNVEAVPNIGGVSIYLSLLFAYYMFDTELVKNLILGATIIMIVGIVDDLFDLKPKYKFLGQIAAANVAYLSGLQFEYQPVLSYFVIVFWFLIVMNALNFIDGIDGLSSGVSLIIIFMFGLTNSTFFTISMLIVVSIIGFMLHNGSAKKIYLGDNGSMLLGYIIAFFLGYEYFRESLYFYPVPFIFVFIILYDLVFVVMDREIRGVKFWKPEKNHLHHRILRKGYNQKQTLLIIYMMVIITCLVAIFLADKITKYI